MAAAHCDVNGRRLAYELDGPDTSSPEAPLKALLKALPATPLIVLLHDGLGTRRGWRAQIPFLHALGWRTLAYDRWGYGDSQARQGIDIPDFEDDLADLAALLDALGLRQAALLGHSDGATIALRFAARHPERMICLAAVAAHIYVEPKMGVGINAVRREFQENPAFRAALERMHGGRDEDSSSAAAVFENWYRGWMRPQNMGWDMRPELARIACPCWIAQGSEDEHAVPQHARDLAAALPHADLCMFAGAGHRLPQENAAEFNQALGKWLEKRYVYENLDC